MSTRDRKRDPLRLLDADSGIDDNLRQVLQSADLGPSEAQIAAVATAVRERLAPDDSAEGDCPSADWQLEHVASSSGLLTGKWLLVLATVAAVAVPALWWWLSKPATTPTIEYSRFAEPPNSLPATATQPAPTEAPAQPSGLPAATQALGEDRPRLPTPASATPSARPDSKPSPGTSQRPTAAAVTQNATLPGQRFPRRVKRRATGRGRRQSAQAPTKTEPTVNNKRAGSPAAADNMLHGAAATSGRDRAPNQAEVRGELELLMRAQSALVPDPAAALAALGQHARTYPDGRFAQERDALRIDALGRLGRLPEQHRSSRVFLNRYPNSPHAARLRELLR